MNDIKRTLLTIVLVCVGVVSHYASTLHHPLHTTGVIRQNQEELSGIDLFGQAEFLILFFLVLSLAVLVIFLLLNIRRRKTIEKNLVESRNQFKNIVDHSLQGIAIFQDAQVVLTNQTMADITGYTIDEMLQKSPDEIKDVIFPADWKKVEKKIHDRFEEDIYFNRLEHRIVRKDGSVRWIKVFGSVTMYKGKEADQVTAVDITDIMKAEEQILKLSMAVEQSSAAVLISDIRGKIEYVNPKFKNFSERDAADVLDNNWDSLTNDISGFHLFSEIMDSIKEDNEWHGEISRELNNGRVIWQIASIYPIYQSNDEMTHIVLVAEDITEQKQLEDDLRYAKEQAEESDRLKSALLKNLSHEYRAPIQGIIGFAGMLSEEMNDIEEADLDEMKNMVSIILRSGNRLMKTLNSLLELALLETNQHKLIFSVINVALKTQLIYEKYKREAQKKNLYLDFKSESEEILATGDDEMFDQIIVNILDNALKYTEQGGVEVTVEMLEENDQLLAAVHIKDTGIGIDEEKYQVIFEEFRQASEGLTRSYEGAGLGLSLSKRMIDLLRGEIRLESEVGKGSTFTVLLPGVRVDETNTRSEKHTGTGKKDLSEKDDLPKVLLVEDNEMNKDVMIRYMRGIADIDHAEDGLTALKMVEEKEYELVLLDINLGIGIDGVETVQQMRRMDHYKDIPICAVTAYVLPEDRQRFLNEGCSHYIAKPFEKGNIVRLVEDILNGNA